MHWIHHYQLFLFDFDGLLVDTEPVHFAAYKELCANHGFELNWDFQQFCQAAHFKASGMKQALYDEFPGLYAKESNWSVLYQEKKDIYVRMLKEGRVKLLPGVEELLKKLDQAGLKRCVVTNSPSEQINIIKQMLPVLQTIPLWLTREFYNLPKPSPDGYLKAIELIGQPGEQTIGFEDSMKGIESLVAAGVKAVLICPSNLPQVNESAKLDAIHFGSFQDVTL